MTVLRRFDKDIADMHSMLQLAANDLYMVLAAFQDHDGQMANDRLAQFFNKMKEANQKIRDLKINISLAEEEEADNELNKEYKSDDQTSPS